MIIVYSIPSSINSLKNQSLSSPKLLIQLSVEQFGKSSVTKFTWGGFIIVCILNILTLFPDDFSNENKYIYLEAPGKKSKRILSLQNYVSLCFLINNPFL